MCLCVCVFVCAHHFHWVHVVLSMSVAGCTVRRKEVAPNAQLTCSRGECGGQLMQVCTRYWAVIQPQGASQGEPLVDGEEEEGGELEEGEEVRSVCWGPLEGGGEPP